jgi:hypothetical protein
VLTGDQHAAEDLPQNTLVKAAANWGRIHTAPEAYVRRIMYREQVRPSFSADLDRRLSGAHGCGASVARRPHNCRSSDHAG